MLNMVSKECKVLIISLVFVACTLMWPCMAMQHVVGGNIANYEELGGTKTYHVGDTLAYFPKAGESLVQLSEEGYQSCKISEYPQVVKVINDTTKMAVDFSKEGVYYFSSSLEEDCRKGMKLKVVVKSHDTSSYDSSMPSKYYMGGNPIPYTPSTTIPSPPLDNPEINLSPPTIPSGNYPTTNYAPNPPYNSNNNYPNNAYPYNPSQNYPSNGYPYNNNPNSNPNNNPYYGYYYYNSATLSTGSLKTFPIVLMGGFVACYFLSSII